MYRNKILVITTILIALLLGVMIWSANVVAEHNSQQKDDNVIGVELPQAQDQNSEPDKITEITDEEEKPSEDEDTADDSENSQLSNLVIDTSNIVPTITKREQSNTLGRNYIDQFDFSNGLTLWNISTFPLHIYIEGEDKLPAGFADGIKVAFNNWQQASEEFVKFEYVTDPTIAEIVVSTPKKPKEDCPGENGIEYEFNKKNNRLLGASIVVPQTSCTGTDVDTASLYTLLQHTIGHILGINTHSQRPADVMYSTLSYENTILSDIDITTLKLLYNFVPSVTNKNYTNTEMRKMIRLADVKNKKPNEILNILNTHINANKPEDPLETTLNEAYEYYQNGNYIKAQKSYLTALNKAENALDKAYINNCLAIICIKLQKYPDALNYANMATEISPIPKNKYLSAYINFVSGNETEAQANLENLLARYPKFINAYSVLAQIYKKQENTDKLNALVQQSKEHFMDSSPIYYKE